MGMRRNRYTAELLLVLVTLCWALSFPLLKVVLVEQPVLGFLAVRFVIALAVMTPLAWGALRRLDRRGWWRGLVLGVLLFLAFVFQTIGLDMTSSSNAGFLSGLCVVWVPLLAGPLCGKPPGVPSMIGVLCALPGLFLLTWQESTTISTGDLWVLGSSLFIALHIIGIDRLARDHDGRALAWIQIAMLAALSLAASWRFDPALLTGAIDTRLVATLLFTALAATVFAFWAQTTVQGWTTPTRAALIFLLEPLMAAVFSVWLLGDRLGPLAWAGGTLIVFGMLAAELGPLWWRRIRPGPLPATD